MTEEERNVIMSEDYADLIIDYRYNPQKLNVPQDAVIQVMNEAYAVMYVPAPKDSNRLINEYSYSQIPKLHGLLSEKSIEASGINQLRNLPNFALTGKDVLIGFVDTGIDYRNSSFVRQDGTTKIAAIWDQTIQSENGYPFNTYYGTEYLAAQINEALKSQDPLKIVPSMDTDGHGTMLAGVAAGNKNEEANFEGVAPDAELVIVKVKQAKKILQDFFLIPKDVVCYQDNDIMWGVQYCIQTARRLGKPIAICLAVGTSQTAHSGESNLGNLLSIIGDFSNIGIVIAVGNEGNLGRHYYASFDPATESTAVEMSVGENESDFSMEIWGDLPGIYSVDITSPSGEFIPRIAASRQLSREISFIFERTIINIDYRLSETLSGKQLILLRFRSPAQGIWRFNIYSRGDIKSEFHMWLPMGKFISENTFFVQANIYTTILSPSTSSVPIAVTAYNPFNGSLFENASRGYTSANEVKPELAAPGVNYPAPSLNGEFINYTGTGVAAAHTVGIVALFLEWAVVNKKFVSIDTLVIKKYLIRGAQREGRRVYPNRDWGFGKIDIFNVFNIFRVE